MAKRGTPELLSDEAERVTAALRELLDSEELLGKERGNKAALGRVLGITGQAITQNLHPERPSPPSLDTARKVAKRLRIHVYELLWPQTRGSAPALPPPPSNFELAREIAEREGWSEQAIAEVERFSAGNLSGRSPTYWLKQIEARHEALRAPAEPIERVQLREPDAEPKERPERFADRLRARRLAMGWSFEQLASRTEPRVNPRDIEMLEQGKTMGQAEADVIERLRRPLAVTSKWLGSPATDQAEIKLATPEKGARKRRHSTA